MFLLKAGLLLGPSPPKLIQGKPQFFVASGTWIKGDWALKARVSSRNNGTPPCPRQDTDPPQHGVPFILPPEASNLA
jgi:hypothetical protein